MKNKDDDDKTDGIFQSILEKKFLEMNPEHEEAPADLKEEVFGTLNTLIMVGDLVDLFTLKFAQTELNFLDPTQSGEWEDQDSTE